MFINFLDNPTYDNTSIFISNGGYKTLHSYLGEESTDFLAARQYILNNYNSHYEFLKGLPYYHETEEHVFVHAGINPMDDDWKQTSPSEMIWIREFFINNPTRTDKTVIFGHTPTLNIHGKEDVWFGGDKIGIDGACCYGFRLNCLEISNEGYKTQYVESKVKTLTN
jgi:serine/threonine protein phosphatase 1